MKRNGRFKVTRFARNQAVHFLSRRAEYRFSENVRSQLIQVVAGHIGPCDERSAQEGLDWMRDQARRKGDRVRF